MKSQKDNFNLFTLYYNSNQYGTAADLLHAGLKAGTIDGTLANWQLLASSYEQINRDFDSIQSLKEATEKFPKDGELDFKIAEVYYGMNNLDQAFSFGKMAMEKGGLAKPTQTYNLSLTSPTSSRNTMTRRRRSTRRSRRSSRRKPSPTTRLWPKERHRRGDQGEEEKEAKRPRPQKGSRRPAITMKRSKIYLIAPIVVLVAFVAYYWNFKSGYDAKQAETEADPEVKRQKLEEEAKSRRPPSRKRTSRPSAEGARRARGPRAEAEGRSGERDAQPRQGGAGVAKAPAPGR